MNHEIFKPIYDYLGLNYPGAYATLLVFSFIAAFPLLIITAKKMGLTIWKQILLPFVAAPFSLIFSRCFHVLFEGNAERYFLELGEKGPSYLFTLLLNPLASGHVFYGGLFGGFLAGALITLINYRGDKGAFLKTFDSAMICVANGLWITRIGCFFEGCCFGRPSNLFGISFPQGSKTMFMLYKIDPEHTSFLSDTQPIIPTQLIHSLSNLIIFIVLLRVLFSDKPKNPGFIAALFLFLYSITRFFIEFLRFDVRGSLLFLSTSQWISIILFFVGYKLLKQTSKRRN